MESPRKTETDGYFLKDGSILHSMQQARTDVQKQAAVVRILSLFALKENFILAVWGWVY